MKLRESHPKGKRLVAGVCGLLLAGSSGCGRSSESRVVEVPTTIVQPISNCTAVEPEAWSSVPKGVNAGAIANILGIDTFIIKAGRFGLATCQRGLTAEEVTRGVPVSVEGINPRCLAVGILGSKDQPFEPEKAYNEGILAVCAFVDWDQPTNDT